VKPRLFLQTFRASHEVTLIPACGFADILYVNIINGKKKIEKKEVKMAESGFIPKYCI
jgi:hypothetical protein